MKTKRIAINNEQWLSQALKSALGSKDIPTNTILHKTLPGLGATYGELKAKRDSIIIEPNVPVIIEKTKGKPKYLDVKEGCTVLKIKNYLNDSNIKYKKLLTTPESYHRIKSACNQLHIKIHKRFFCLFDECEKLIQDVDYRNKITQPINDFFLFDKKAFVSATCLEMTHPEFERQKFRKLIVTPKYDYRKNIDLIMTDDFEFDAINKFHELKDSECICVFMNKTDSIDNFIYTLGLEKESKVFCSYKSVKKLKAKGFSNAYENIDLPLAKYNFFTSRFFSAVDIEIKKKPDILILTNLEDANHTMIDPFSEAIQIYGRFRKKYHKGTTPFKSLTHITNFKPNMETHTKDEVDSMIDTWKNNYDSIMQQLRTTSDNAKVYALTKDLNSMTYIELLDENKQLNYFSRDNLYNEERVKKYYTNPLHLLHAYKDTRHFIINPTTNISGAGETKGLLQNRKSLARDKRKYIIDGIEKVIKQYGNNCDINDIPFINVLKNYKVTENEIGEMIIEAYFYLGRTEIEKIGYGYPARIKEALNKAKAKKKEIEYFHVTIESLKCKYGVRTTAPKNNFKNFLKNEYQLNGINIKVTQDTIRNYCDVTSNNGISPATFTIQSYNLRFGENWVQGLIEK